MHLVDYFLPASLSNSSLISYDAELSGSDSGSAGCMTGGWITGGAGSTGSNTSCTILGEPAGGEANGVGAGDMRLGGDDLGLALGVGSGVLTAKCCAGGWKQTFQSFDEVTFKPVYCTLKCEQ